MRRRGERIAVAPGERYRTVQGQPALVIQANPGSAVDFVARFDHAPNQHNTFESALLEDFALPPSRSHSITSTA
jgi:hypothetical protein